MEACRKPAVFEKISAEKLAPPFKRDFCPWLIGEHEHNAPTRRSRQRGAVRGEVMPAEGDRRPYRPCDRWWSTRRARKQLPTAARNGRGVLPRTAAAFPVPNQ